MDSPTTLAALDRADALRADLDAMRPLDADRLGAAMQRLRIEWTYHSNAIEGNSLTYGETRALLMHGVTADGKPLKDHLDITGHREALDFLEAVVQSREPLTLVAVREMHRLLLGEPYESWAETSDGQRVRRTITPGEFKTQPNHVVTETGETHYYARPEEVPARMQDLMDRLRDGWADDEAGTVHPVVFASDVHHRFAAIHPFDDGNGRMARLLMNLVLMRAGYPPAVLRQENRPAYYGALAAADGGDLAPLVRFVAGELATTLELYLRALRGEPDPDEFARRAALLKREVETRSASWNRSPDTLRDAMVGFVDPLVTNINNGILVLKPLFSEVSTSIQYGSVSGHTHPVIDNVIPIPDDWNVYACQWHLSRFVHDPQANLYVSLQVDPAPDRLMVTVSNIEGPLAYVEYGRSPDADEVDKASRRVLVALVGEVEMANRRANEKRET